MLLVEADGVTGAAFTDFVAKMRVDGSAGEGSLEFDVELEAGEERGLEAEIEVRALPSNTVAAFEISQTVDERVLGGLGVVLVAARR